MAKKVVSGTRQQSILSFINENGSATIHQLSEWLSVSEATVRRDLDDLAASNYLERTHGGAMRVNGTSFERNHSEKMNLMLEEKRKIAAKAVSLVRNGDSVFLDSGTTTFFVAQCLSYHTDLTVITNNLDVAASVELHPSSSLIVTGGMRRDNYSVLVGSLAEETIKGLYVDICFLGCDAFDPSRGVFNTNYLELGAKKLIAECGRQTVLVTDHSKFQKQALAKVCGLKNLDVLITDSGAPADAIKKCRQYIHQVYVTD